MIRKIFRGAIWNNLLDFFLPRLCCGCGERILNPAWLVCEPCMDSVPDLLQPICTVCGCPDARVKNENRCTNCPPGKIWFTRARGAVPFAGIAQTLVLRLKFKGRLEYAPLIALNMAKTHAKLKDFRAEIIVPVPLHRTRFRHRGFNQSTVIARHFKDITGLPLAESLLTRIKPTPSQTRLKRSERRKNVVGAFACKNPELARGKRILLIDDVYTTGSTLNECARVLMEAGAESVECLAYARAFMEQ